MIIGKPVYGWLPAILCVYAQYSPCRFINDSWNNWISSSSCMIPKIRLKIFLYKNIYNPFAIFFFSHGYALVWRVFYRYVLDLVLLEWSSDLTCLWRLDLRSICRVILLLISICFNDLSVFQVRQHHLDESNPWQKHK